MGTKDQEIRRIENEIRRREELLRTPQAQNDPSYYNWIYQEIQGLKAELRHFLMGD